MPFMEAEAKGEPRAAAGTIVMATVKGDVHDIGKNIVGVVLQCNNYRGHRSRRDGAVREDPGGGARAKRPTSIGLSGLITPSLDEMVHVAQRDGARRASSLPLLIGGATTSRVHTAVKIAPGYDGPPCPRAWTPRAPSASSDRFCRRTQRDGYRARSARGLARPARARTPGATPSAHRLPLAEARANRLQADWSTATGRRCRDSSGSRVFDAYDWRSWSIAIDWAPFFQTWELSGRYPAILDDPDRRRGGPRALRDAQAMLERIVGEKWLAAARRHRLLPGERRRATTSRSTPTIAARDALAVVHTLRQQMASATATVPIWRWPISSRRRRRGIADWLGGFAVTSRHGLDERRQRLRGATTTTTRDHGEGAGRPAGRGLRRAPARARAPGVLGLCGRTRIWPTRR